MVSLIITDDEHFFICLASNMSSFESVCSYPSPTFEWVCLFFSCKSVLVLRRFWILALCQMDRLQNFFPFCWLLVHSNDSFAVQMLWSLIRSHLFILVFVANAVGVLVMKSLPMPMS